MTISPPYTDERGTYTVILSDKPGPCGTCRGMTMWFIERGGRTQCCNCDVRCGCGLEAQVSGQRSLTH